MRIRTDSNTGLQGRRNASRLLETMHTRIMVVNLARVLQNMPLFTRVAGRKFNKCPCCGLHFFNLACKWSHHVDKSVSMQAFLPKLQPIDTRPITLISSPQLHVLVTDTPNSQHTKFPLPSTHPWLDCSGQWFIFLRFLVFRIFELVFKYFILSFLTVFGLFVMFNLSFQSPLRSFWATCKGSGFEEGVLQISPLRGSDSEK